jgi:DNA polymerase-3 subunit gamma/tau
MAYLVLARKYRPQRFGEMAGQEHVVRTLGNALARGQLAHAFLFTGPRGVGKTTAARLVAKAVNCEQGPTAEPCGRCTACVEIAEGRAVDVVEIDAASNNGVDNVRDIVEAVKYRPARDRYKVFVIDEVHMLSTGAFNALLKTLEEPPEHVKFVLATTDVHKVPETIVSRCQRFDFRRLTQQQIVDQLRKIAVAEGLEISDGALALVARTAQGGMRDALSLLDQVRAACGDQAPDAAVAEALGTVDPAAVSRMSAALLRRDGGPLLTDIESLYQRGQEMKRVAEELVRHLRNVTVAKLVPDAPLDLPDAERREVLAQAELGSPAQLARVFDIAQRTVAEVKFAEQPRYALEVGLLKACYLAPGAEVSELVSRLDALAAGAPLPPSGAAPPPPSAPSAPSRPGTSGTSGGAQPQGPAAPTPRGPARWEPLDGDAAPVVRGAAPGPVAAAAAPAAAAPVGGGNPAERWRAVVAAVEGDGGSLLAVALKQAALVSLAEDEVTLRPPAGLNGKTLVEERPQIEAALARHFGRPFRVTLTAPDAASVPALSVAAVERAEREVRSRELKQAARAHPNIKEAARILGGDLGDPEEIP